MEAARAAQIDPGKARSIIGHLTALASHPAFSPWGDVSEAQFQAMGRQMVIDLADFDLAVIETAIMQYRNNPQSKGFPSSGKLVELCAKEQKHRREMQRPKPKPQFGDTRPIMWWTTAPYFWRPHWRIEEIPDEDRGLFLRKLKRKIDEGDPLYREEAFYGAHTGQPRPV